VEKIGQIVATLTSIYPTHFDKVDMGITTKIWNKLLTPYTDEEVSSALWLVLEKCTYPPTPAEIINEIKKAKMPNKTEEWAKLVKTLRKVEDLEYKLQFTAVMSNGKTQGQIAREQIDDEFNKLSPTLKSYVGSVGELRRLARDCDDESLKYEKNKFMKIIDDIQDTVDARLKLGYATTPQLAESNYAAYDLQKFEMMLNERD